MMVTGEPVAAWRQGQLQPVREAAATALTSPLRLAGDPAGDHLLEVALYAAASWTRAFHVAGG